MLRTARRAFYGLSRGCHLGLRTYHSISDPEVRHLFEYTSGRFLFNEEARLAERYVPFNVGALKYAINRSLGRKDTDRSKIRKWMEGRFCRVMLVDYDDGEQVVVKIPYKSAIPRKLTTESEVATLDLLHEYKFPVPHVYCWGSDCDNEVGAAYIVMAQAKGTPLPELWRTLSREEILPMMQSFVELEAKLFELPFRAYGSIYYKDGIIPDAFQTELFTPDADTGEAQTSRFCIGPIVERSFWRGKLFDMAIDRGPWESPAPFLYSVGLKEKELARKYGEAYINQIPYTDIIRGAINPDEFLEVLQKYLAITPYILPSSPVSKESRPLLRHPCLRPEHIFLGDDGRIATLTGWQYSSILPSLLVCGNPLLFSNPDNFPAGLDEPALPRNYYMLFRKDKETAYIHWRDQMLYYYYTLFTTLLNKPNAELMLTPFQPVIANLVSSADRPWRGDSITLKCAIIRFVQVWDQIMSSRTKNGKGKEIPKCPLELELSALEETFDLEERWNDIEALREEWRMKIGICEDGRIETFKYDEAVKTNKALKKQWLDREASEDCKRAGRQGRWPFDDYEEPD